MSDALLRNGNSLLAIGRPREALSYFERYLAADPSSAEAWHNRGVAFAQTKRHADALACYDRALALRPDSAQTWNARGNVLFEERRYSEAPAAYENALALDPGTPYARGYHLLSKLWCCDWHGLSEERAKIGADLADGKRVIQPFGSLMILEDPAALARAARIWMTGRHGAPAPLWRGERYGHERVRIAYISGDFHDHPVAHLMAGVFEHHDPSRFETIGVSFGPDDGSAIRERITHSFEKFIDARNLSDFNIASFLREQEIDIAVDLMGLTADSRSGILAHRPAPVQVNYLGFPGTMASAHMDYLLADELVLPEMERQHYSEKIVYLPDCYMPADSKRPIAASKPGRAEAGLPEQGFVFCSFNNAHKFSPETFAVWMRLLAAVEASVLWLPEATEAARSNLSREAAARGIAPNRLVFAPFLSSQAEHLARVSLADLFLDTLPCNAHTTACDALWTGVPILTCLGTTFPGRVAASFLHAVGLPELVTHSMPEYEARAAHLARERGELAAIRAKLARNRDMVPLFNTARFTKNLEAAYREMAERAA